MRRGERGIIPEATLEAVLRGYSADIERFLTKRQRQGDVELCLFIRERHESLSACFHGALGKVFAGLRGLEEKTVTGYELRMALAQSKDEIGEALHRSFPGMQLPVTSLQSLYGELADSIDAKLIPSSARKR